MIRVITALNPEQLLASMCSMGTIMQDWVACFDCMQYELISDSGPIEKILHQHSKCSSRLYTSSQMPSYASNGDSIHLKEVREGLIVRPLHELPKFDPRPSRPYVGTIKLGGRRFRATQAPVVAAKEAEERSARQKLGKLSPEKTREIVGKYLASLTKAEGSDCLLWSGPKSIRLYKSDGSTEVTRSAISVATFLAFGKALSEDKISRSCGNVKCVSFLHLVKVNSATSPPLPISEVDLIKQLVASVSRPKPEEACLTANHQYKSLTLVAKGSDGRGQKTAVLWKAFYYLAFGSIPSDDDRTAVRTTCGYLPCVNPDHLSLSAGQNPHPQWEVLVSLGQLMKIDRLDQDDCLHATEELSAAAIERFGPRNHWSYWTPFLQNSEEEVTLNSHIVVAALALRFLGWCLLPQYVDSKDSKALECKNDPECINPFHRQEAILNYSTHSWNRKSILTNFNLVPQQIANFGHS